MNRKSSHKLSRLFIATLLLLAVHLHAQFGTMNKILDRLEERRGVNMNLGNVKIDGKRFVLIKDFDDYTERNFFTITGNSLTYVEVFDDKHTGKISSNVFSGDVVRTQHNIISLRADRLEGKKIALPLTKTLLLTRQDKILHLKDINTGERWIEDNSRTSK